MSDITDVAAAVQARMGEQYLIEQTTPDDSGATAINTDSLYAAAADAIGLFELETGITFNSSIYFHLTLVCDATTIYLEERKARDSVLGALKGVREKRAFSPATNSNLDTHDFSEKISDMDGFHINDDAVIGIDQIIV